MLIPTFTRAKKSGGQRIQIVMIENYFDKVEISYLNK